MQLNWKGILRWQELLPCQKNFQPTIPLRKAWWKHIPPLPRSTVGLWASYACTRCSATHKDCVISTQPLANHGWGLLPVPLLPTERDPPRKLSISKGNLRAGGCRGTFRVSVWKMETACHAGATPNVNASPGLSLGPAEVTALFCPYSLQLRSLGHFALLRLWSCHGRVPLPEVHHRAALWKMPCMYSVFGFTSACGCGSLLTHLTLFHCQKRKQLVKIRNNFIAVCSQFAMTHLLFFHCSQILCN